MTETKDDIQFYFIFFYIKVVLRLESSIQTFIVGQSTVIQTSNVQTISP